MRRIPKKGPPAGNVSGGTEVFTWIQAEKGLKKVVAELTPDEVRRAHFDKLDKPKVRARLLKEQRGLCVFCERLLQPDQDGEVTRTHIAHWTPIARDKTRALEWKNLYASCDHEHTCDGRQKDQDLGIPRPSDKSYEDLVVFGSDGTVLVGSEADGHLSEAECAALRRALGDPMVSRNRPKRGDPDSTLNLNHKELQEGRKAKLDALRLRIQHSHPGKTLTKEEKKTIAQELLAARQRDWFISIQIAWLQRTLDRS